MFFQILMFLTWVGVGDGAGMEGGVVGDPNVINADVGAGEGGGMEGGVVGDPNVVDTVVGGVDGVGLEGGVFR